MFVTCYVIIISDSFSVICVYFFVVSFLVLWHVLEQLFLLFLYSSQISIYPLKKSVLPKAHDAVIHCRYCLKLEEQERTTERTLKSRKSKLHGNHKRAKNSTCLIVCTKKRYVAITIRSGQEDMRCQL